MLVAVWFWNVILLPGLPPMNGVMSMAAMVGLPATGGSAVPCAVIVVPCGIDAMRATVNGSCGLVVAGTASQMPGSK